VYRDAYGKAIRTYHSEGRMARTWPLRYLIRHTAFHTMDTPGKWKTKNLTGLNNERRKAIQRALCALIHLTSVSREVETRVVVPSGHSGNPIVRQATGSYVAVMGRFNLERTLKDPYGDHSN